MFFSSLNTGFLKHFSIFSGVNLKEIVRKSMIFPNEFERTGKSIFLGQPENLFRQLKGQQSDCHCPVVGKSDCCPVVKKTFPGDFRLLPTVLVIGRSVFCCSDIIIPISELRHFFYVSRF